MKTLEEKPTFVKNPEISLFADYTETDEDGNVIVEDKDVMCIYLCVNNVISRITRLKDYGRTWTLTREELEHE